MPIRPENRARYPKDWKDIVASVRKRSGDRCECLGECGRGTHGTHRCPNVQGGAAYGSGSKVILTTAHLDHTPETRDLSMLRHMCQGCHLHYDREHHAQTAYATRRQGKACGDLLEPKP